MKKNEYEIIRQKMIIKKNGKNKDDFHYLKEICHWEKKTLTKYTHKNNHI